MTSTDDGSADEPVSVSGPTGARARDTKAVPRHSPRDGAVDVATALEEPTAFVAGGIATVMVAPTPLFVRSIL